VADLDELRHLLAPLRDAGRGVVALLPGGVYSNEQVFELQREVRRPFTWTALLTIKGYPYHEGVIAEHDAARAEGVEVWPQVSCRPLVFQMNLAEPFTLNMRESFKELMSKTREERKEAYADPSWRAKAWADVAMKVDWSSLTVAESERADLVGRSVVDMAAERGGDTTPLDVMLDLSLEDDLRTRFWSVLANNDPDGIAWLLPRDGVLLGLADSGAHVSQLCDACFATDLLGPWVRDRGVMPLERAIHKLTGEPAQVYGLDDRGLVQEGKAADLVVFDPDTVAPGPLRRVHDFPAGGERLTADAPEGMRHTLVNGVVIREDGQPSEEGLAARPGRLVH
jgi:N-acyl-D-aspartate/D-glutamate deacylase